MGVTKIRRRNANYWIEAVAEGGEDYYTKPGEAPREWIGTLAAELGLAGEVDRDAYAYVLAGRHPASGEALVRRPEPRVFTDASGRERRVEPILGYDVRFAAPKSVSLLFAPGGSNSCASVARADRLKPLARSISGASERAVRAAWGGSRLMMMLLAWI